MNPFTHHGANESTPEIEAAHALVAARHAVQDLEALRPLLPGTLESLLRDCRRHFIGGRLFTERARHDLETLRGHVEALIRQESVEGQESVEVASYGGEPVLDTRTVVRLTCTGSALQRTWHPVAQVLAQIERVHATIAAEAEVERLRANATATGD
ncbi:hypothetical protein ACQ5SP_16410 [Rhodovulum sp. YNF3179]